MKYAVLKCVNGTFAIATEHGENLDGAKNSWDSLCITHRNAPDVIDATISIIDENNNIVGKYTEFIHHEPQSQQPQTEPVTTNEESAE